MGIIKETNVDTEQKALARAEKNARRGVALLDKEFGEDWAYKIDLDELDLESGTYCILGQLYDGYGNGIAEFSHIYDPYEEGNGEVEDRFAATHGFVSDERRGVEYNMLDQVWQQLIKKRFNGEI